MNGSKNKFTLKIMFSYLILGCLALVAGYFILSEIRVFLSSETAEENDIKLLRAGSLLTELHEAESLSKMALQTRTRKNFDAYSQKIDSVLLEIDLLKALTESDHQKNLLDSVQVLLKEKVSNSNQLRRLKMKSASNSSIDDALEELGKMEASFGKLTVENFNQNPEKLEPYKRKILEDWVAYLNENIPESASGMSNSKQLDSVLTASKLILDRAKQIDTETQRSLARKEMELNRNDLELSRQLRGIISAFEREIMIRSYNDNLKKQSALKRSIRLAGFAALMGFIVVGIFTFLITRDFWRVQTYRQKLEMEKKYSESLLKSRERLISTVSHDLRTPLNTISGYSELMENTGLTGKQVGYLRNVKSASSYVNSLVNDLLDFSKLEADKITIERIPFVLAYVIRETSENLKELYHKKNVTLELDIDQRLEETVLSDPFRIRQILTNLIDNAYKFTQEGFIKISARILRKDNDIYTAVITVTDSGIGIKKEKQELIFKEFTQAEESTEKKYGGYGLGLTISKKLADLLGGSIRLESQGDKGSTFSLQLPLERSTSPPETQKKAAQLSVAGLSILILDDDRAMLELLEDVCHNAGIKAHVFNDFKDIGRGPDLTYDLVLTDIQMPFINGFEVLEKLRSTAYPHYIDQPIIAMTGRKDLKQEVYEQAGFAAVLSKPFSKNQLMQLLGQLFPQTITEPSQMVPASSPNTTGSSLFSLEVLHSFLGDQEEAINEVLYTFRADTRKNMKLLKAGVSTNNYAQINQTAHRMLPMFRQLKATGSVVILERLELIEKEPEASKLKANFDALGEEIATLLQAVNSHLTKSPSYSG
ncbi:ATP-binding protein [Flavobacteriaceae bacterium 3-367]